MIIPINEIVWRSDKNFTKITKILGIFWQESQVLIFSAVELNVLFWLVLALYLYARYLCSRDALGIKAEGRPVGQARRTTIGYLVYKRCTAWICIYVLKILRLYVTLTSALYAKCIWLDEVYTRHELSISGKPIFDELARVHQNHLSVDF